MRKGVLEFCDRKVKVCHMVMKGQLLRSLCAKVEKCSLYYLESSSSVEFAVAHLFFVAEEDSSGDTSRTGIVDVVSPFFRSRISPSYPPPRPTPEIILRVAALKISRTRLSHFIYPSTAYPAISFSSPDHIS